MGRNPPADFPNFAFGSLQVAASVEQYVRLDWPDARSSQPATDPDCAVALELGISCGDDRLGMEKGYQVWRGEAGEDAWPDVSSAAPR